ncbi:hypothetical protein GCM10027299_15310 [Larkinella ripae]
MQELYTKENFATNYRKTDYVFVGVTGHRDLLPGTEPVIRAAVQARLAAIRQEAGKPVLLISAYAKGADQLVAECAEQLPDTVFCLPLTMPAQHYSADNFADPEDESARLAFEKRLEKPATIRVGLFEDYSGQLTTRQRKAGYEELGKFLTESCDHLIALWDGVDGGGVGGTSDVVRMMVLGKSLMGTTIKRPARPQALHQLVVPRRQNHFPIGRRFARNQVDWPVAEPYSWVETRLENRRVSRWQNLKRAASKLPFLYYVIGGGILLLCGIDLLKTWYPEQDLWTWGIISGLYGAAGWAFVKYNPVRELLLQFVYPLVIASAILTLGTAGFMQARLGNSVDSFFGAANLITLNTSVFSMLEESPPEDAKAKKSLSKEEESDGKKIELNAWLKTARILGGFLAGYAFILAFALAAGKENIGRFMFFLHRRFWGRFSVVVGDGIMAIDVAYDLAKNRKERVVFLTDLSDPASLALLTDQRIWLFQGKSTSRQAILKTFFWQANEVYVISESDENNFRCAQELDELFVLKHKTGSSEKGPQPKWYVHLQNIRQRSLLQQIARQYLHTFSISENTARRLLLRYPIDRFRAAEKTGIAQVILIGFDQLAEQIALSCLRLGHYTTSRHLHIKVYYPEADRPNVEAFRKAHPELEPVSKIQQLVGAGSTQETVRRYTFLSKNRSIIDFEPLPTAERELIDAQFSLYDYLTPERAVSIYVCLPTGLESASLLGSILPRIEWLKLGKPAGQRQIDVQVFCFYNFPDPDEEQYVEMKLNGLASYVPVTCFGNLIHECTVHAIKNESFNRLARQIALLYASLYPNEDVLDTLGSLREHLTKWSIDNQTAWHPDPNQANVEKTRHLLAQLATIDPEQVKNWADECWLNINEVDRWANIQAADHAWVKLRLMGRKWDEIDPLRWDDYWTPGEIAELGEVEHRRWNAEKLLLGWFPVPDKALWKKHKKELRAQKHHHFLALFDGPGGLPEEEQNKDFTQVVGLPYFFSALRAANEEVPI